MLFIGHGNPMNAIEANEFHRSWRMLGRDLPEPRAILCISAHWEAPGVFLTASAHPATIHDFYGFPRALFDVQYRAPGAPDLAQRTAAMLGAQLDPQRGLDHGAWSVLAPMYPDAGIPVVQLSLDTRQVGDFHYDLAKKLAPLRDKGVLIIGSGNIVHNLRLFDFQYPDPLEWAARSDADIRKRIQAHDHFSLVNYDTLPDAGRAIPTAEHFLPLLYALALQEKNEPLRFFNTTVLSSISMTSFQVG